MSISRYSSCASKCSMLDIIFSSSQLSIAQLSSDLDKYFRCSLDYDYNSLEMHTGVPGSSVAVGPSLD